MAYANEPQMPDMKWAERAYIYRAFDPSLGQSMSFPSYPQLKLRLEVPCGWTSQRPAQTSLMLTLASQARENRRPGVRSRCRWELLTPLEQSEAESLEEEEATVDPTQKVPQDMGDSPFATPGSPQLQATLSKAMPRQKARGCWLADLWAVRLPCTEWGISSRHEKI